MKDLIEALQIFMKYKDSQYPTNCAHDELQIMDIDPDEVSDEDNKRLKELGFIVMNGGYFGSFRFGSA